MSELPDAISKNLSLPLIAAPMFLVSGPELVSAACNSGVIGTFPALNQRSTEGLVAWIEEIKTSLNSDAAAFGVNLIVHRSNPRLEADLKTCVEHQVPLVITSLGAVNEVVDAVHSYGGVIYHDIISVRHAQKAAQAGADGVIAVCAGAGGHAGTASPFGLIKDIRSFYDGNIILAGALTSGSDIAAARIMGADLAYMGTRFIGTRQSMAAEGYKQMLTDSRVADIVYTPKISGVPANFLQPSLDANDIDLAEIEGVTKLDMETEARVWKDVWSAGHGVAGIHNTPDVKTLVADLVREFNAASTGWS